MAKKKKKKGWLGKIGKAAALAAAAYGASKMFGGKGPVTGVVRPGTNPGNRWADARRAMTSDRAYTGGGYDDPIMTGGVGVKSGRTPLFNDYFGAKKGGRAVKRGTGIAKRGFGRALKGKK